MAWLAHQARARLAALPDAPLHQAILAGLPALYLSDPKARSLYREAPSAVAALVRAAGPAAPWLVRWLRRWDRPADLQPPPDPH